MTDALPPAFWESYYQEEALPWDLGQPAPPFEALLQHLPEGLTPGKLAALGSGQGHDAARFAQAGFDVTGFDYVAEAVRRAQTRYGDLATFVQADIFELPASYDHTFDAVLEHTCFCAIHPSLRQAYVDVVHRLLKPQGWFIGLFFAHSRPGGPPYGSHRQEILTLFEPKFQVVSLETPETSHPNRAGEELLGLFRAKPA